MIARTFYIVALLSCVFVCQSFTPPPPNSASAMNLANSDLNYQSDTTLGEATKIERPLPVRKSKPSSKPLIEEISSLDELKWFLEEDERPVVIK